METCTALAPPWTGSNPLMRSRSPSASRILDPLRRRQSGTQQRNRRTLTRCQLAVIFPLRLFIIWLLLRLFSLSHLLSLLLLFIAWTPSQFNLTSHTAPTRTTPTTHFAVFHLRFPMTRQHRLHHLRGSQSSALLGLARGMSLFPCTAHTTCSLSLAATTRHTLVASACRSNRRSACADLRTRPQSPPPPPADGPGLSPLANCHCLLPCLEPARHKSRLLCRPPHRCATCPVLTVLLLRRLLSVRPLSGPPILGRTSTPGHVSRRQSRPAAGLLLHLAHD